MSCWCKANMTKAKPTMLKTMPHQQEGSKFLAARRSAALFDEQGLGKSKQLIDAISQCIVAGTLDGAILVCPNHLKDNWQEEIETHSPGTKVVVMGSGRSARRRSLSNLRSTYYIVNYEAVSLEISVMKALLRFKRFALVLDESHRIKSPTTRVTGTLHALQALAARRYILTGSPVSNRPEDLWSQMYFLDGGQLLGTTFDQFKQRYGDSSVGYRELDVLSSSLNQISLRRTKETHLKLPAKTVLRINSGFAPRQRAMYTGMRDDLRLWVESLSGDQVLRRVDTILAKLTRLVQIASNPRLIDRAYSEEPAKFTILDNLLSKRLRQDQTSKVIVWSSFVENITQLCKRYQKYGAVPLHGKISGDRRRAVVSLFKKDPSTQLLIANPAAAREGLTLVQANTVIYLDRTFNLVDYLQSQDRIHRIGQTKACEVILMIAENSIDEYVDFAIEQKMRVARYVQGDQATLAASDAAFQKPAILAALL